MLWVGGRVKGRTLNISSFKYYKSIVGGGVLDVVHNLGKHANVFVKWSLTGEYISKTKKSLTLDVWKMVHLEERGGSTFFCLIFGGCTCPFKNF